MLIAEDFLPLKKSVVEYFYHTWIVIGKRDLYEDLDYVNNIWKITEVLVDDLEKKLKEEDSEYEVQTYGPPLNYTFKKISDKYVYHAVYLALGAVLKLNLRFDGKEQLLQRIATSSCELFKKVKNKPELRPYCLDVINTMYNSAGFTRYLDNLDHPLLNGDESINDDEMDEPLTMKSRISKRNTLWVNGTQRTKASIYYLKLSALSKNEDMQELLEKEFEKMVVWFSDFSEN